MAQIKIYENDSVTAQKACEFVIERSNEAIKNRGMFTIGLSGGSAAKYLCNGLPELSTDWSKWRVYFCDERHVSHDDSDCTYQVYKEKLMSKVPLAAENIFPDNPNVSVEEAAKEYTSKLKLVFGEVGLPQFDLLVLGMGPDGHTCSLFPGHKLLQEDKAWVAAISDSPKPPPERITFTFPVLNNARAAMFISCGAGKAEMVQRVVEGSEDPPLPAARVKLHSGDVYWFLDKPAAGLLKTAQL